MSAQIVKQRVSEEYYISLIYTIHCLSSHRRDYLTTWGFFGIRELHEVWVMFALHCFVYFSDPSIAL